MSEPSWNDLEKPQSPAPKEDRIADICARLLTTPDGKELLAELRRKYFDGGNPLAEERALRVLATQQHFVRELERARDRGLAAAATRKAK